MLARLCPSAIAVWISGQRARIWPAFVAGFFPRRCARRCRVSVIHCCSAFVCCSPLATYPTVYGQFRHISTYFGNTIVGSTLFDVVRHQEARRDPSPPVRRPKTLVVEHKRLSDEVVDFVLYFIGGRPLWASDDPDQLSATCQTDYFDAKSRPKAAPPAPL